MLVISRRPNERVRIGDNIEIVIVAVNGDKVRLGIEAPKDIAVHREEVYKRLHAEGQEPEAA